MATATRNAWAELESLQELFEGAKREAEAVALRSRLALREVTRAEGELRRTYSEPSEDAAAVKAAREALSAARAEAEPAIWQGRLQRAQDAADRAGAAVEDFARRRLDSLVAELAEEEEASRLELGARWEALRQAVDRADTAERKMWRLARLLGLDTDQVGEHPIRPVLRAGTEARVTPRPAAEWPSRLPAAWLPEPEAEAEEA
jgi:hypothetical protein